MVPTVNFVTDLTELGDCCLSCSGDHLRFEIFQAYRNYQSNNTKIALSELKKVFLTNKMFSLSSASGHLFMKRKSDMAATG